MAKRSWLGICAVVIGISACGGDDDSELRLSIQPTVVAPGEMFGATLEGPSDGLTETTSVLERRVRGTWKPVYVLGSHSPRYSLRIRRGRDFAMGVGLDIGTTEELRIPADLKAGEYRLVKSVSLDDGNRQLDVSGELRIE